jgi:hypothetical protein
LRAFGLELISVSVLCRDLYPGPDDASEGCDQDRVILRDSEHISTVPFS